MFHIFVKLMDKNIKNWFFLVYVALWDCDILLVFCCYFVFITVIVIMIVIVIVNLWIVIEFYFIIFRY